MTSDLNTRYRFLKQKPIFTAAAAEMFIMLSNLNQLSFQFFLVTYVVLINFEDVSLTIMLSWGFSSLGKLDRESWKECRLVSTEVLIHFYLTISLNMTADTAAPVALKSVKGY